MLLLAVLAAAGFVAYRWFRIEEIVVRGNSGVVTQEILARADVKPGTHILEIDRDGIVERLLENPFIKSAQVDYSMPDTLLITVEERKLAAVIRQYDKTICIDHDGLVLNILPADDTSGVLVVKGVAVTGSTINQEIALVDDYQLEVLREVLLVLEETGEYSSYSELDLTYSVDIRLTTHEGMEVRLGQAVDLEEKLLLVKDVRAQLSRDGIVTGSLSATNTKSVTYAPEEVVISEDQPEEGTETGQEDPGQAPEGEEGQQDEPLEGETNEEPEGEDQPLEEVEPQPVDQE